MAPPGGAREPRHPFAGGAVAGETRQVSQVLRLEAEKVPPQRWVLTPSVDARSARSEFPPLSGRFSDFADPAAREKRGNSRSTGSFSRVERRKGVTGWEPRARPPRGVAWGEGNGARGAVRCRRRGQ